MKINLNEAKYTEMLAKAPIYAKKGSVQAVQMTTAGLESDAYADRDIRFDSEAGRYVVDTYVMRQRPEGRVAELEDTRVVEAGEWLVTNPKQQDGDRANNYVMPDAKFRKRYEATDNPGVYRAKGMARIVPNDSGEDVEIDAPWGGTQTGDASCYFCAPYNRDNPDDLADGHRYILSENDFAAYGLADEVLGQGWNE